MTHTDTLDTATSWSARKRHYLAHNIGYALCHVRALQPGDWSKKGQITRELIDSLPICSQCAKAARRRCH